MGKFSDDLKIEEQCYEKIIKPDLLSKGINSIFVRYSEDVHMVYKLLQKKNDIDIIADDGIANWTISLKTVRNIYPYIFFETIKNTTTGEEGWGYYTKADMVYYVMLENGKFENYKIVKFRPNNVQCLPMKEYKVRYGETHDNAGTLLYKTKGRLIPVKDII